jgi:hypothetical protein
MHAIEHLEVQHHNFKKNYGHILSPEFIAEYRDTIAIENLKELLYKEFPNTGRSLNYYMEKSGFGRLHRDDKYSAHRSAESLYDFVASYHKKKDGSQLSQLATLPPSIVKPLTNHQPMKKVSDIVHQYEQQATVQHTICIDAAVYDKLPPENLAALKLLLKQGYTVQLTVN